jgi:predicted extracellular nuclease
VKKGWIGRSFVANVLLRIATLSIFTFLFTLTGRARIRDQDLGPLVPICKIQGRGSYSPFAGQTLRIRGVVFADLDETSKRGFFIQQANCDADANTSDGLFVYIGSRTNVVSPGDLVEVTGQIQEYYGMTEVNTQPDKVTVLSRSEPLPGVIELSPPADSAQARDYFESLESMYVALSQALVVGPTDSRDETWVISSDLGLERVLQHAPGGTGQLICVDDGGLYEIAPEANVGDRVSFLVGVLEYTYGLYRLQLVANPNVVPKDLAITPVNLPCGLTIASFNLENLFDTLDDPLTQDSVLSATEYRRRLRKLALAIHSGLGEPAIIAVQEVENPEVLSDLTAMVEIDAGYDFIWQDGPDQRGIDVALLYRKDRAQVLEARQMQACTTLVDGLGPDGNRDVANPQNQTTCDSDADGVLDGNRMFSRPPLLVHLEVYPVCGLNPMDIWVIVNHWKSRSEDTDDVQYTLPRRLEQAKFIAFQATELSRSVPEAKIIILGDLNDYPDSQPLLQLEQAGFGDLAAHIPSAQRYTYIYHGVSQVLDHVLVNGSFRDQFLFITPVHFNADYAEPYSRQETNLIRSSDHDPILAWFGDLDEGVFLPLIRRDQ